MPFRVPIQIMLHCNSIIIKISSTGKEYRTFLSPTVARKVRTIRAGPLQTQCDVSVRERERKIGGKKG